MKKILLSLAIMIIYQSAAASGIRFIENKNWKALVALAKKENKLIFLDAYATWCGPCKYLQNSVFTDASVGSYFNTSFINVKIDMEEGEGPALSEEFGVTAYPTLFFINGDGELVHKYVGALDPSELISLGKTASDPEKQYYPLKEKALSAVLKPSDFHDWVHAAEKIEDEDKGEIISKYISSGNYPLLEEQMLKIIFEHEASLKGEQLDQLAAGKSKVMNILGMDARKLDSAILKRAISYALDESMKADEMDFDVFRNTIARYNAGKAALETQKMKVVYHTMMDEDDNSLDELAILLTDYSPGLPGGDLIEMVADLGKVIAAEDRGAEFIRKVEKFRMLPEESGKEYYKDFALLTLYYFMENRDKISELGARITANPDAPETLKDVIEKIDQE